MAIPAPREKLLFGKWSYDDLEARLLPTLLPGDEYSAAARHETPGPVRGPAVTDRPGRPVGRSRVAADGSQPLWSCGKASCVAWAPRSPLHERVCHLVAHTACCSLQTQDISLDDYVATKKTPVFQPHTAGRYQKKRFRKGQCPIVERCERALVSWRAAHSRHASSRQGFTRSMFWAVARHAGKHTQAGARGDRGCCLSAPCLEQTHVAETGRR